MSSKFLHDIHCFIDILNRLGFINIDSLICVLGLSFQRKLQVTPWETTYLRCNPVNVNTADSNDDRICHHLLKGVEVQLN